MDEETGKKSAEQWRRTGIPPDGYKIVPPDGKWGWAVLFGGCLCGLTVMTRGIVFSILLNNLISLLNTTTATITWSLAISSGVGNIMGPLITVIITKYSCRKATIIGGVTCSMGLMLSAFVTRVELLLLTHGILTGVGFHFVYCSIQVQISRYFRKYYGVATGILTASYASAKFIMAPVVQLTLEEYGPRGTLLIAGGFMLNVCVGAFFFQPSEWHSVLVPVSDTSDDEQHTKTRPLNKNSNNNDGDRTATMSENSIRNGEKKPHPTTESDQGALEPKTKSFCSKCLHECRRSVDLSLFQEPLFYFLCLQDFLLSTTHTYGSAFLYPFGLDAGLEPMESAGLVSARALGDIGGRLLGPLAQMTFRLPTRFTYITAIALHGCSLLALTQLSTVVSLYTLGVASGAVFGTAIGIKGVLVVETMDVKRLPSLLGLSSFVQGFLILVMGPLIGWIRDVTGTYKSCFIFLTALQFIMSFMWLAKPFLFRKRG